MHRAFGGGGHLFTTDLGLARSTGLETESFFWVYAAPTEGLVALHRCRKSNGKFFLTTSSSCEGGGTSVEVLGYIARSATCGSTPLYRLHLASLGNHFHTISAGERDNAISELGYAMEGVTGHVWMGR